MSRIDPTDEFDKYSWHDCRIYGIEFRAGDPGQGEWTSDLRLDIDYICQWLCDSELCSFRVAPAFLVFHEVMNLKIAFERRDPAGLLVPVHPLSISEIERQPASNHRSATGQSRHRWKLKLNDPDGGAIEFLATGFTQTYRAEPVLLDQQCLSLRARQQILADAER